MEMECEMICTHVLNYDVIVLIITYIHNELFRHTQLSLVTTGVENLLLLWPGAMRQITLLILIEAVLPLIIAELCLEL